MAPHLLLRVGRADWPAGEKTGPWIPEWEHDPHRFAAPLSLQMALPARNKTSRVWNDQRPANQAI